jgi:hypothetical protein
MDASRVERPMISPMGVISSPPVHPGHITAQ